jgi:hypothetical protein
MHPNTNEDASLDATSIDLGLWLGRQQAFGLVANKCSAGQAECLKQIRERKLYQILGLTWEQFCQQHAGISRVTAEKLIRDLDEFGETYFRLSELVRITAGEYRQIAPHVQGEALEFEGATIPITSENSSRIRQAVTALRHELDRAKADLKRARSKPSPKPDIQPGAEIPQLQARFEALFKEIDAMVKRGLDPSQKEALEHLLIDILIRTEGVVTTRHPVDA